MTSLMAVPRLMIKSVLGYNEVDESTMMTMMKFLILSCLCCQATSIALVSRYSKGILKERYSNNEIVFWSEVLKLLVSMVMIYKENSSSSTNYLNRLVSLLKNSQRILLIVGLYSFINVLSFHALGLLNAAVYTILIQLKVLTTAFFGVYMLKNNLSLGQWFSLFHMVMGSILIVSGGSQKGNNVDDAKQQVSNYVEGILMVFVIVTISGYSAVFMEKVFKSIEDKDKFESVDANDKDIAADDREKLLIDRDKESTMMMSSPSIWDRNFQLAFFSMLLMLLILVLSNAMSQSEDTTTGPFAHWSTYATVLLFLQGGGGLLAAATLKYTNANLKTLATTLSIVFSTMLEYCLMGLHLNLPMIIGILTIIASISSFTIKPSH